MGEEKEKPKEKDKDPPKKEEKEAKDKKKEENEKKEEKENDKKKEEEKDSKLSEGKDKDSKVSEGKHSTPSKPSKSPQEKKESNKEEGKKDEEKVSRKKLKKGMIVKTVKHAFKIDKILGSGGFGDVYKVVLVEKENELYAMKTEYDDPKKKKVFNRLKVETVALEDLNTEKNKRDCFVKLIDKGTTPQFRFIVMELLSYSLHFILKEICKGSMPDHSATYLMRETLNAITTLHELGYIHRDVKPHNFAVGMGTNERRIYLIDFGISRKFLDEKKQFVVPRERVQFLGTLKYCSRACHLEKEQSMKDDLECWAYMCLEFYKELAWNKKKDRDEILKMKKQLFAEAKEDKGPWGPTRCFFADVLKQIDKMTFTDGIKKTSIQSMVDSAMKEVMVQTRVDEKTRLVWEGKVIDSKPRKKTVVNRVQNDEDSEERRMREKRKEKMAMIRRLEAELMKVMDEIEDGNGPEEKKEEAHRLAREKQRKSPDQRKRRSGGRKRKGPSKDDDEDEEEDEDEDEEEESYDERRRDRRRPSKDKKRYRDEESKMKRKDSRKNRSRVSRTNDDPKERRRSLKNRKTSTKNKNSRNSRRKSHRRTSEVEEKLAKFEESQGQEKGRILRKRSSVEKGEKGAEKEEMDGEKKDSGKRDNKSTPEGTREGDKISGDPPPTPSPSYTPSPSGVNEGWDKGKKK